MKRTKILAGLVPVLLFAFLLTIDGVPVHAQTPSGTVDVYYIGPEDAVAEAIRLADPYLVRVNQPDLAEVIVVNNAPLQASLSALSQEFQDGRVGLVLFSGPAFPRDIEDLRGLIGVSTFLMAQTATPATLRPSSVADPLQQAVNWRSAPQIAARTVISNPNLLQPITVTEDRQAIIQRVRGRDQTQGIFVGAWFSHPSNENWTDWAYFNYLIYRVIADAADAPQILSYADYPASPAPRRQLRLGITGLGIGLLLGAAALYYAAKRHLYLQPKLIASERRLAERAAQPPLTSGWGQAGFHRPLAGFLTYLPFGLLFFVPLSFYQMQLLPEVLLPGTQGIEAWRLVARWTAAIWILLDAGTGVAAIRAFSTRHIHQPQRAPRYLQFYTWWQLLSGTTQLGLICLIVGVASSGSSQAHLAYYLLARAALQFPGFFWVFALAFRARQQFSQEQNLNALYLVLHPLLQAGLIWVLRRWGAVRPNIGAGLGGVLGIASGVYLTEILVFLAGAILYRRDGYPVTSLFLPAFDKDIAKEILSFGFWWALAAALPAVGVLLEPLALGLYASPAPLTPSSARPLLTGLPGTLQGTDWLLALQIAGGFEILLVGLYYSLMPTLTEAVVLDYKTLLRYYVTQSIRYGAWFSFFFLATLGSIGIPILAVLFNLDDATMMSWLPLVLAWGALRWAAWLPDRLLEAAGRPSLLVPLTLAEQIVRLIGASLLVGLWQTQGLIIAYITALGLRILLARILTERLVVRSRLYIWQTLIAPAISAVLLFQLLRMVGGLLTLTPSTALIAGVITLPLSLPFYAFLTGVLGGWDDGGLTELHRAVSLSGIGYLFGWTLLTAVRLGARISPLHGRFPLGHYQLAQEEAQALTFAQMRE